jgi:hypothetical protein
MGMRHAMELALATLDAKHAPARELRRRLPRPRASPRAWAPPCPAGPPTARRSCAWR